MKSIVSKYLSVNAYDILKAAILASLYALTDSVINYYNNKHNLPSTADFKAMLIQSGVVFILYLKLKFVTNSEGKLLSSEQSKVVNPSSNAI